jgi:5-methylcytosine-specific restriction endonuclease McrA
MKKRPKYKQYMKSRTWKSKRKGALRRALDRCQICYTNKETLHVHHRTYSRLGREKASDLIVLCETCHKLFHEHKRMK